MVEQDRLTQELVQIINVIYYIYRYVQTGKDSLETHTYTLYYSKR